MNYQRNFGSKFPDELIDVGTKKNVDDSVLELVNQYNAYIQNKDIASAEALYDANKSKLSPYKFDSFDVNRIYEEVYNVGLCALSFQNTIISDTEPVAEQMIGSVWLKEY